MNRSTITVSILGIVVAIQATAVIAQGDAHDSPLMQAYLNAKNPQEAGEACLNAIYWEEAGLSLEKYVCSEDPRIALPAAWWMHALRKPQRGGWFGIRPIVMYEPAVQRFVGFAEGCLSVRVPLWWEEMLHSPDRLHPQRSGEYATRWVTVPASTNDEHVTIPLASRDVAIPAGLLTQGGVSEANLRMTAAVFDKKLILVGEPSDTSLATIWCLDLANKSEVWRTSVWGSARLRMGMSGPPIIRVEEMSVQIDGPKVTVFGGSSDRVGPPVKGTFINTAMYIEQFMLADGNCIARFATNNWGTEPDTE